MTTHLRTVAAAVVDTVHAPPAITFLHELQFQMPTAVRLTESWRISRMNEQMHSQWYFSPSTHLAAECAGVASMLCNFHLHRFSCLLVGKYDLIAHLFNLLSQRGTITLDSQEPTNMSFLSYSSSSNVYSQYRTFQ
jgi:hypothetical protein